MPLITLSLPPTITLGGLPNINIAVYKPYVDPGASATDAHGRSLSVTVSGVPEANFTATVTLKPIVVTYTAVDAANQSITAVRMLSVFDPCGPSERTCSALSFTCSVNQNCGAAAAGLSALLGRSAASGSSSSGSGSRSSTTSAATAAAALAFSAPDVTPPVITILGSGQPFVTSTGATGMITTVLVGETYVDVGAMAIKIHPNALLPPVNLTTAIVVTGVESVSTAAPTSPDMPFVISYDVYDNAIPPNAAVTVRRRVRVICPASERVCNNDARLTCSFGGVCMGAAAAPTVAVIVYPPSASIMPILTLNGPSSVTVSANKPYVPCLGTMTTNCDLGATATLNTTGDFNGRIKACIDQVRGLVS